MSTFNAARLVRLGGEAIWLRAYTLDDLALVIGWLDDVLEGRDARDLPPEFGSAAAQAALFSLEGISVQAYAALRHHGMTPAEADTLATRATPKEWLRFLAVAYSRRRTAVFEGGGEDLSRAWWGPNLASLCGRGMAVGEVGALTLDQLDALATEGCEAERPGRMTQEQVQAMYDAARAAEAVATTEAN